MKRVIDTEFWNDDKVVEMFSPEDKLFFLYLMTNPHTTQLGIYHINKKHMAFELGYSIEAVTVLLDRFENKYKLIRYSEETSEVAIKNYLKHSIVKGGKPIEEQLKREITKVKDKSLFEYVFGNLVTLDNLNETVQKILPLLKENANACANAYAVSLDVHDSVHTSVHDTVQKRFKPPTIQEVKAYCIERGNTVDPERFVDFYASKGWMVGKNKMKDWKAAVRTWEQKDKPKDRFGYIDEWGKT